MYLAPQQGPGGGDDDGGKMKQELKKVNDC